jgi:CRP-like cAMP-binding protein
LAEEKQNLLDLLIRIPLFDGFVPTECQKLLQICKRASFEEGKTIYPAGTPQLMVLLKGTLRIELGDGSEVAVLEPLETVGEMEVLTGAPRVASVVAVTEVSGLLMSRPNQESLIEREPFVGIKLLRNLVGSLSHKLVVANEKVHELSSKQ